MSKTKICFTLEKQLEDETYLESWLKVIKLLIETGHKVISLTFVIPNCRPMTVCPKEESLTYEKIEEGARGIVENYPNW